MILQDLLKSDLDIVFCGTALKWYALMAECDSLEREIKQRDALIEDLMASCLVEMENGASGDEIEELGMVAENKGNYKSV